MCAHRQAAAFITINGLKTSRGCAIESDKDARKVTQIRAGETSELEAFYLVFENDEGGGVRLRYRTAEQTRAPLKAAKAARQNELREVVLAYVREANLRKGVGPMRKTVVKNVEGNDTALYSAIDGLIEDRILVEVKDEDNKRVKRLWLTELTGRT